MLRRLLRQKTDLLIATDCLQTDSSSILFYRFELFQDQCIYPSDICLWLCWVFGAQNWTSQVYPPTGRMACQANVLVQIVSPRNMTCLMVRWSPVRLNLIASWWCSNLHDLVCLYCRKSSEKADLNMDLVPFISNTGWTDGWFVSECWTFCQLAYLPFISTTIQTSSFCHLEHTLLWGSRLHVLCVVPPFSLKENKISLLKGFRWNHGN